MARRKPRLVQLAPDKVVKPSGIKNDGTPNVHWRRFEQRLAAFESVPVTEWKEEEVLGYLLKKYNECYEIEFSLSYSRPPSKSSEIYCIKRIMTTVGTTNGVILKQYIDWVFDTIIGPQRTKLQSLGFFFTPKICNQFKSIFRKNNKITRTTELPSNYLDAAISLDVNVHTYGDLAFAKMAIDQGPNRDDLAQYTNLFAKLRDIGFDESILVGLEE